MTNKIILDEIIDRITELKEDSKKYCDLANGEYLDYKCNTTGNQYNEYCELGDLVDEQIYFLEELLMKLTEGEVI